MRIMGLDVGDKTVGVAISDALMLTAQGIETVRRQSWEIDLKRLNELIEEYSIDKIVVGLPRNMNGTEGERCDVVRDFAEHLKEVVSTPEIIFWDERLSTVAAEKYLVAADVSRAKRRKIIDKMAAVFILQGYLDSNPQKLF
ncbi:Holliday junction resolvase RuvX [Pectinatus brassicae]|uniref:Putative pre-16S rRNA nuclease n=1 Tax=Pectinatus brassicae TaxID=862415 RepID=A0A840UID0_9FIRM|nr:Holliday junction resolvase RuvX [Pectinatus brassicae]MBB5336866.1 putative Holliday junction resolvase [Pectinatus brassicae]